MLCYAMVVLRYAMPVLLCAVLYHAMLCYAMLCCAILCHAVPCVKRKGGPAFNSMLALVGAAAGLAFLAFPTLAGASAFGPRLLFLAMVVVDRPVSSARASSTGSIAPTVSQSVPRRARPRGAALPRA